MIFTTEVQKETFEGQKWVGRTQSVLRRILKDRRTTSTPALREMMLNYINCNCHLSPPFGNHEPVHTGEVAAIKVTSTLTRSHHDITLLTVSGNYVSINRSDNSNHR